MIKSPEQVIQPQPRRKRHRSWRKEPVAARRRRVTLANLYRILKISAVVTILILSVAAYQPIVSSSMFALKQVSISGNTRMSAKDAEALVSETIGGNVLKVDLADVRRALMQQPLIKDAVVTRILPDTIRVKLSERAPVAVVQASGKLLCVDKEGIVLGDFSLMGAQPPLLGWDERTSTLSQTTNRERLRLYLDLKQALSSAALDYWDQVEQVDVRNVRDVIVSLEQSPSTQIHLGNRDFPQRFKLILNILDDVLQGRLQVTYIDVSDPSRVVVRPPKRSDTQTLASRPSQ